MRLSIVRYLICFFIILALPISSFITRPQYSSRINQKYHVPAQLGQLINSSKTKTPLFAKKQKKGGRATRNKIGNRTASVSGFGGAATQNCPCGLPIGYMKCCGKIHKSESEFSKATPQEIVRARYSAYAKREVDFIVGSTHPLNKQFMTDIEHWKETIR